MVGFFQQVLTPPFPSPCLPTPDVGFEFEVLTLEVLLDYSSVFVRTKSTSVTSSIHCSPRAWRLRHGAPKELLESECWCPFGNCGMGSVQQNPKSPKIQGYRKTRVPKIQGYHKARVPYTQKSEDPRVA